MNNSKMAEKELKSPWVIHYTHKFEPDASASVYKTINLGTYKYKFKRKRAKHFVSLFKDIVI